MRYDDSGVRVFLQLLLLCSAATAATGAEAHLGKTLEQWRAQLGADNRVERLVAARSLGEMAIDGQPGALEAVTASLDDADSAVRYWGAVALGELGAKAKPAEQALRSRLDDPAPEVQVWSAYALVRMGDERAGLQKLIEQLANPEKGARLQAVTALDQLGEAASPAVPEIEAALDDEFDYVQRIARHALWTLGRRPCPYAECP
ncbi:MAG: hypothetical protein GC160_16425 [Acidobacteria bacterium]|nr:hypothetical protein [Acidobacteriota bacterium]